MLGRFKLQKLLSKMKKAGCKYAVIETSSEGIKQYRHRFINYDIALFTNLSPEHIEAHGTFEKYRIAKQNLFKKVSKDKKKKINEEKINKTIIANVDDKMTTKAPAPEAKMHTVVSGESLSKIAKKYYGDPMKYTVIFEANQPTLKDPDKIYPGQVLRIPEL